MNQLADRGVVEALETSWSCAFEPQHRKPLRWKLAKVKGSINSILSEFIYVFPKWDFLPGDPWIANLWNVKKYVSRKWKISESLKDPLT